MKYDPFDKILSNKAKKNKKEADEKPYFNNTHDVLGLYKNPKLSEEENEDEEDEEKHQPKGFALLKRVYKDPCWDGYEQFGTKVKSGKTVPNCIPASNNSKKGGGTTQGAKIHPPETPPNLNELMSENEMIRWAQKFTKAIDKRTYTPEQKQEMTHLLRQFYRHPTERGKNYIIDRFNNIINDELKEQKSRKTERNQMGEEDINIVGGRNCVASIPANKIKKSDPLYKVSNPNAVQKQAFELYGDDAIIYKSDKPDKKYKILNPDGKWVYFGQMKPPMEDFFKHQDLERRKKYIARASNIKGNWRKDIYSPNYLSLVLLWNAD